MRESEIGNRKSLQFSFVIPGRPEGANPDCGGKDAGANIRGADGPEG